MSEDGIRSPNLPPGSGIVNFLGHDASNSLKRFPRADVLGPIEASVAGVIDAANARMDELELGQVTGGAVFATKADMDADLLYAANVRAEVYADSTAANNGVYRKNGISGAGSWTKISDLAITIVAAAVERAERSAQKHIELLSGEVESGGGQQIYLPIVSDTSGFTGWGVFDQPPVDDVIDGFVVYTGYLGDIDHFTALIVQRPATDVSATAPGAGANDITYTDLAPAISFTTTTVLDPGILSTNAYTKVVVKFARPLARFSNQKYLLMVKAFNVSNVALEVGRLSSNVTGLADATLRTGWAFNSGGGISKIGGVIATVGFVFRRITAKPYPPLTPRYSGDPTFSGLVVDLNRVLRHGQNGSRPLFGSPLTVSAATTGMAATFTNYPLTFAVTGPVFPHANINITAVRRASDNVLLTRYVDYNFEPSGILYGRVNIPTYNVNVTYDWANERVDLITERPEANLIAVIAGTERPHSAHEDLYRGQPTDSSQRSLFHVRVVGAAIADITKKWDWVGPVSTLRDHELIPFLAHNKRVLAPFLLKLLRGTGVIIAGYGDSNTQAGGGSYLSSADFAPNRTSINGTTDGPGFNGMFYDSAAESAFSTAFFGSVATVTMNGALRVKAAPNWHIIDHIQKVYGYSFVADVIPGANQITYLNFGIGGTTTQATTGNMGDPARLAVLVNPSAYGPPWHAPDLIIVHAGMNGTPSPTFVTELGAIVTAIKAAGIPMLLHGPHLTNVQGDTLTNNFVNVDEWQLVNDAIWQVARHHDVGFMPVNMIQGPGNEGYMGLQRNSLTRAEYGKHPGPYERRKVGEFLARAFDL